MPSAFGAAIGVPFGGVLARGLSPADQDELIQWLSDYDGDFVDLVDPLQTSLPETVNVNCLSFDGTQFMDSGVSLPLTSDFEVSCYFKWSGDLVGGIDTIFAQYLSGDAGRMIVYTVNSKIALFFNGATGLIVSDTIATGAWYQVKLTRTAGEFELFVAEIGKPLVSCGTYSSATPLADATCTFGAASATPTLPVKALFSGISLSFDDKGAYYPCVRQLPVDVSGNGNHATSSTAVLTTADDIPSYCLEYGLTPDGSGGEYPALLEGQKTSAVATFDGVGDKLLVSGISPVDVVTCDGTATPTAGTGEITFTAGTAYNIKVNGGLWYKVTDVIGKTSSTLDGVEGFIPTASIVTTSSLNSFWAKRIADPDGVYVDAKNYELLGVAGAVHYPNIGVVLNGSSAGLRQTSASLNWSSVWYDSGFKDILWSDAITIAPYEQNQVIKWMPDTVGTLGTCLAVDWIQYPEDYDFTPADYTKTEAWRTEYSDSCGADPLEALTTDDGELLTTDDGYVLFT